MASSSGCRWRCDPAKDHPRRPSRALPRARRGRMPHSPAQSRQRRTTSPSPCTTATHDALKADRDAWAALPPKIDWVVGDEVLQLRDCPAAAARWPNRATLEAPRRPPRCGSTGASASPARLASALGWTRAQLAGKTGLSPETVRNLEMGYVHRPTRRTLRLVAVALDIYLPDDGGCISASTASPPDTCAS